MGRLTTLVLALGLLALPACSGDADPSPPPSPSPTATTSAPTPSPVPPVIPEAAKAHTKAGAKAFVEYFWETVNYAQSTGDTAAIKALSAMGCTGCEAGISSIDGVYAKGGRITGGNATVSKVVVTFGWAGETAVADATFDVDLAAQVVTDPSGSHTGKPRHSRDRFNLLADQGSDWRVTDFKAVR